MRHLICHVRSLVRIALPLVFAACVDPMATSETTSAATPRGSKLIHQPDAIPERYIVVLNAPDAALAGPPGAMIEQLATARGVVIAHRFDTLYSFAATMSEAQAQALAGDPAVAFVEEDMIITADAVQNEPIWGLDRIDEPDLPVDGQFAYLHDGAGATIYVIDGGIRSSHVELTGRIQPGFTAVVDGLGTEDCNGHGTHVAGTAAGTRYGVAKRADLVPIRVFDCAGDTTLATILAGIDWMIANRRPASVANMSFGGGASEALDAAVREAVAAGIIVVAAAGNDNRDACLQSPAREPLVITVGATTPADTRASFSNFGTCVDIMAPGDQILSAVHTTDTATELKRGTSMAAPHVAGAVALYLASHPDVTPEVVAMALARGARRDKLTDLAGSPNLLLNTMFVDTTAPVASIASPADGDNVAGRFQVRAEIADDNLAGVELSIDGSQVSSKASGPFVFDVEALSPGAHSITITARDSADQTSSETIEVTVTDAALPPEVVGGCSAPGHPGGAVPFFLVALLVAFRGARARGDHSASSSSRSAEAGRTTP